MKIFKIIIIVISFSIHCYGQQYNSNWDLPQNIIEARSLVKKADSLFNVSSYEEAAEIFEKIVVLNPEDIKSIYNLSLCYHLIGNYKYAIKYHKMVADFMETDHTDGLRHYKQDGFYNLACAYSLSGDIDNSIKAINMAIESGFDNAGSLIQDTDFENLRKDDRFSEILKSLRVNEFQSKGTNTSNPSPEQIREGAQIVLNTIKNRHPNPYRHFDEAQWDEKANSIIAKSDKLSETAYLVELMGLVGMAGDVHSSAFSRGPTLLQDSYSLRFWKFSDGLYVRAASEKLKHLIGAKVIAMNNVPFKDAWKILMEKFPTENEWMSTYMIQLFIQFPSILNVLGLGESETGGSWTFLMPDNKQTKMYLEAEEKGGYFHAMATSMAIKAPEGWTQGHDTKSPPLWLKDVEENYWYEITEDKHAVFFQMNVPRYNGEKPYDEFLDEMFNTINENEEIDRLIIDLRHHEGGWDYMAKNMVHKILQSPKLDKPGGIYIISGRITQSAGIAFIGWPEMETYPIIVGEPAGAHPLLKNGAWGNHTPYELPGTSITFRVSTHNENFTDAIDDRHIIAPDIPTSMTYEEYKMGVDPALEAALSFPMDKAHILFEDAGGRLIPRYLPWHRLSQKDAFEKE